MQAGEPGDAARVDAVALASGHAQAPFQVQRADERVRYAALLQEAAQGQRVVARVLHAHQAATSIGTLLDEPGEQFIEARRSVGELVVGEMVGTFGLTERRVDSGLGDVDTDKILLVHRLGGLGEKSRTEYTEMLIPLISLMLRILNGNRSVKRREGLIPAISLFDRRPHSSPLTPSDLLVLYFLKLTIISQN